MPQLSGPSKNRNPLYMEEADELYMEEADLNPRAKCLNSR